MWVAVIVGGGREQEMQVEGPASLGLDNGVLIVSRLIAGGPRTVFVKEWTAAWVEGRHDDGTPVGNEVAEWR